MEHKTTKHNKQITEIEKQLNIFRKIIININIYFNFTQTTKYNFQLKTQLCQTLQTIA